MHVLSLSSQLLVLPILCSKWIITHFTPHPNDTTKHTWTAGVYLIYKELFQCKNESVLKEPRNREIQTKNHKFLSPLTNAFQFSHPAVSYSWLLFGESHWQGPYNIPPAACSIWVCHGSSPSSGDQFSILDTSHIFMIRSCPEWQKQYITETNFYGKSL